MHLINRLFILLLAVATVPSVAMAQIHTQVFLIPYNKESTAMATKVGGLMERQLQRDGDFAVVDLTERLGGKPSESVQGARGKAKKMLEQGKKAYSDVDFDGAADALTTSIEIFRSQAAWLDKMPEYKDALAFLAATYILRGDEMEGRKVFKELVLNDATYRLKSGVFDPSLTTILDSVKENIRTGPVGSVSVRSRPPGARVFIDGKQVGYTNSTFERIPTGRHVLRVETMGTYPYGEMIDVTPTEDLTVNATLDATDEYKDIQTLIRQIGKELTHGNVGSGMTKLGGHLDLDWAIYGVVTQEISEVTVDAWVVHIPAGKRIASLRTNFPNSEFNLDKNVEQYLKDLLKDAHARASQVASRGGSKGKGGKAGDSDVDADSDDPLDRRSGTEDWWKKRKKRDLSVSGADSTSGDSEDPLDNMDGTEDW